MIFRPWQTYGLYPLAVGLLTGIVVGALVGAVTLVVPWWNGAYLAPLCALAAAGACWSHALVQRTLLRVSGAPVLRAAECGILFLLVQIATNVGEGRANPLAGLPRFDAAALLPYALVIACWLQGGLIARDLDELGELPRNEPAFQPPAERLAGRFFAGGAALLIAVGIALVHPAQLLDPSRLSVVGPLPGVLAYFLLGLLLLAQVQYALSTHRWRLQRLSVAEGLSGRWLRYGAAFFGLVVALAAILPTRYTVGLLDLARAALSLVAIFLWFLSFLVSVPLLLLSRLFPGLGSTVPNLPAAPPLPPPPPPEAAAAAGGDWLGLVRSLIFWGLFLALAVYLLRQWLAQHPRLLGLLARLGPLRLLRRLWAALRRRLAGYAETIREQLPRRSPGEGPTVAPSRFPRFVRLGALSPREQVLYYYLSIVRRAGRQGMPRGEGQTPAEYGAALAPRLPEASAELEDLTEAFVEARYSPHEVAPPHAGRARASWQRVRAALQALKRRAAHHDEPDVDRVRDTA